MRTKECACFPTQAALSTRRSVWTRVYQPCVKLSALSYRTCFLPISYRVACVVLAVRGPCVHRAQATVRTKAERLRGCVLTEIMAGASTTRAANFYPWLFCLVWGTACFSTGWTRTADFFNCLINICDRDCGLFVSLQVCVQLFQNCSKNKQNFLSRCGLAVRR